MSKHLDKSYEERAEFTWIIDNAPPQLKEEMDAMACEILGAKRHREHFLVPGEKAAEALGMSADEVDPIMKELEAQCLYPDWNKG